MLPGFAQWAAVAAMAAGRLGGSTRVACFDPSAELEGIAVSFRRPGGLPGSRVVLDFTFDGSHGRSDRMRVYVSEVRSTGAVPMDVPWICPPAPRCSDPVWRLAEFVVTSTRRVVCALQETAPS